MSHKRRWPEPPCAGPGSTNARRVGSAGLRPIRPSIGTGAGAVNCMLRRVLSASSMNGWESVATSLTALRKLPRRQREVVVLRYLADFSEADVAVALGCSVGTVKSQASRGLSALRNHFGGRTGTDGDDVRAS